MKLPEPFGYFKAEPFGWTDCAETDEGSIPLWDNDALLLIERQRDELLIALEQAVRYLDGERTPVNAIAHAYELIYRVKGMTCET